MEIMNEKQVSITSKYLSPSDTRMMITAITQSMRAWNPDYGLNQEWLQSMADLIDMLLPDQKQYDVLDLLQLGKIKTM